MVFGFLSGGGTDSFGVRGRAQYRQRRRTGDATWRAGRLPMQDYPLPAACRQSTICCASRKKN
ncbi:hypothetical protein [Burkholderia multivorans]|uniref:Uncharacterized protein n=1 Tax=Burkholderia multivorans TaxID=87883 RepID=A0AB37B1J7_9BURK|nr:hypothetical protein [Burkholderia multivorans]MBU9589714.1 hypothetical protein [Burkholderia multivorans]PRE38973.1 hypothetical protein C6P97_31695 [Burkholderia multivorans]PRE53112.1 hypothetical protein C6P99_06595 [Burkholderia multivorans]